MAKLENIVDERLELHGLDEIGQFLEVLARPDEDAAQDRALDEDETRYVGRTAACQESDAAWPKA